MINSFDEDHNLQTLDRDQDSEFVDGARDEFLFQQLDEHTDAQTNVAECYITYLARPPALKNYFK